MDGSQDVITGSIAPVDEVSQQIAWAEQVQALLPPDGYYFIVTTPDGAKHPTYSLVEAEKIAAKAGGIITREITRKGLLTLALATATSVAQNKVEVDRSIVGSFICQVFRSDYETIVMWLRATDLQPVAVFCTVLVENNRMRMPGTGAAYAVERRFPRPGDLVALAESRAISRALESAMGGGSVSDEYEAAPPVIPQDLDQIGFIRLLTERGVTIADATRRLGVKSITDISDYAAAARQLFEEG